MTRRPCSHGVPEDWRFDVEKLYSTVTGRLIHLELDDVFTAREVGISFAPNGVSLDIDGRDGDEVEAGSLAVLTPDVARELALALFMAAEEFENCSPP